MQKSIKGSRQVIIYFTFLIGFYHFEIVWTTQYLTLAGRSAQPLAARWFTVRPIFDLEDGRDTFHRNAG
jgi:hypothetical protein